MNAEWTGEQLGQAWQHNDAVLCACLAGIADGDEKALERLYDSTLNRVYGLALRITASHFLAEEVVADVYLQVWRKARAFDPARGNPIAWLLVICRSRALDMLRASDRAESHADMEPFMQEIECDGADPQDLLLATEQQARIHQVLGQLAGRERQLISLAFFRGMSHAEIAEHLNLPLGTVKSGLRRALIALRAVALT